MLNCIIADGINRIKNGYKAQLQEIELYYSKFVWNFLNVLKKEGYIEDIELFQEGNKQTIGVKLKYFKDIDINNKEILSGFSRNIKTRVIHPYFYCGNNKNNFGDFITEEDFMES